MTTCVGIGKIRRFGSKHLLRFYVVCYDVMVIHPCDTGFECDGGGNKARGHSTASRDSTSSTRGDRDGKPMRALCHDAHHTPGKKCVQASDSHQNLITTIDGRHQHSNLDESQHCSVSYWSTKIQLRFSQRTIQLPHGKPTVNHKNNTTKSNSPPLSPHDGCCVFKI